VNDGLIRILRAAGAAMLIAAAFTLSGCGAMVADLPVVGLPEGAPARPANPGAFPAVHDMPAARDQAPMEAAERDRLERELTAARDRQTGAAAK
jgi:hypothetical protein